MRLQTECKQNANRIANEKIPKRYRSIKTTYLNDLKLASYDTGKSFHVKVYQIAIKQT